MSMRRTIGVYQPRSRRTQIADIVASGRAFLSGLVLDTVRRALGVCVVIVATFILAALVTYDPNDPSFNVATWRLPRNWMGAPGANSAGFLFQTIGWAAFALPLPLAIWGFRLLSGCLLYTSPSPRDS